MTVSSLSFLVKSRLLRDIFLCKSINVVSLFVFFKERKAAKLSKEELKKLHSETQRLIRGKETNTVNIEV